VQAAGERGLWTRRRVATLLAGYAVGLGAMLLIKGVFLSADRYFLILLAPALALRAGRAYVRDFLPFIALVLLYEEARGVAHLLHPSPFYEPMIRLDRWIGLGELPTTRLQGWLWQGHLQWYDHALSLLNRMHFIVPPTLLLLIWLERREVFYRCAATLLAVSYAGAVTFLAFPAAPPWMASKNDLVPHVYRIGYIEGDSSPLDTSKSWIAEQLLGNPVAAVPSLHAAYATLVVLFAYAWRGRPGAWLAAPYALGMWFNVVYLGDHYVVDIIVGVAYALLGWKLVPRLLRRGALRRLLGPFPPPLLGGAGARGEKVRSGHE
jgi:membrane-associated phospholipid phosphatase